LNKGDNKGRMSIWWKKNLPLERGNIGQQNWTAPLENLFKVHTPFTAMTANFVIPQDVQRFFVLVDVEPGQEDAVMERLTQFPETKEIHLIAGKHDILLCIDIEKKILEESLEKGLKFIKGKIRPLSGVRDTDTLTVGKTFIRKAP